MFAFDNRHLLLTDTAINQETNASEWLLLHPRWEDGTSALKSALYFARTGDDIVLARMRSVVSQACSTDASVCLDLCAPSLQGTAEELFDLDQAAELMKDCVENVAVYQDAIVYLNLGHQLDMPPLSDVNGIEKKDLLLFALNPGNWQLDIAGDVLGDAAMYDDGVVVKMTPIMKLLALLICVLMVDDHGKTHVRPCVTIQMRGCMLSAGKVLEAVLRPFCPAYARVVDEANGWAWKMGAYNPEISIMVRVDCVENEWLTVKLDVDRRFRRDIKPGDRVLLMQVFRYEIPGELVYGDDPQPIWEQ
ncbi:hypothetical protein QFC20_007381 [Naganishia adeliensis]|uniref:Uncharacterized protein n=1 Tax=Naganishia adeliensis TaxID=92952 RepID=A0ACC2UZB0_9TREE|nr:hypothetical protein QFC20_007381 [Naganishia adeliensis]